MDALETVRRFIRIALPLWVFWPSLGAAQPVTSRSVLPATPEVNASGMTVVGFVLSTSISDAVTLPINLRIPDDIRPLLERIWLASPTFRRQCARLAESSTIVTVYQELPWSLTGTNGLTTIERAGGLAKQASVHLARVNPEVLAHELEHVLEQIDGVDLVGLVSAGVRGAHYSATGVDFETLRASAIGESVAREVGRATEACARADRQSITEKCATVRPQQR